MRIKVKNAELIPGERFRSQWASFESQGMDVPFKLGLGESNPPYPPGTYELAPECFGTNQYHKLQLNFVRLLPIAAAEQRKSA